MDQLNIKKPQVSILRERCKPQAVTDVVRPTTYPLLGLPEVSGTDRTSVYNRIFEICKAARKRRADFEARIAATTSLPPSARDQELEVRTLIKSDLIAFTDGLLSNEELIRAFPPFNSPAGTAPKRPLLATDNTSNAPD
ncbi:unnamed protein product [Dibothriocephalus latus]|uniref:Uncharacterized protein n=1 Tax=Dibothriocephalus latus TaxID=60516 RepID=A0A3P7LDI5_DIBLA|nr:unnamed protein product [Dibothriocephalus latus]